MATQTEILPPELAWLPVLPEPPALTVSFGQRLVLVRPQLWLAVICGVAGAVSIAGSQLPWNLSIAVGLLLVVFVLLVRSWRANQRAIRRVADLALGHSSAVRARYQAVVDARTTRGDNYAQAMFKRSFDQASELPPSLNWSPLHGATTTGTRPPPWLHWRQPPLQRRVHLVLRADDRHVEYFRGLERAYAPMVQLMTLVDFLGAAVSQDWCLRTLIEDWLEVHADECPPVTAIARVFLSRADAIADAHRKRVLVKVYVPPLYVAPVAVSAELRMEIARVATELASEKRALAAMQSALMDLPMAAYGSMVAELSRRSSVIDALERRAAQLQSETR